ncbi:hypothetical protein TPA0909_13950 [Streptomyces albus]|nr:hypothetical protein TPA0909_13950 [Streptomyces albus]
MAEMFVQVTWSATSRKVEAMSRHVDAENVTPTDRAQRRPVTPTRQHRPLWDRRDLHSGFGAGVGPVKNERIFPRASSREKQIAAASLPTALRTNARPGAR